MVVVIIMCLFIQVAEEFICVTKRHILIKSNIVFNFNQMRLWHRFHTQEWITFVLKFNTILILYWIRRQIQIFLKVIFQLKKIIIVSHMASKMLGIWILIKGLIFNREIFRILHKNSYFLPLLQFSILNKVRLNLLLAE